MQNANPASPEQSLVTSSGTPTHPSHPKTSPDTIFLTGTLSSNAIVSLSHIAAPIDPVDDTGLRWNITGSEGVLEITIPKDMPWQMGPPAVLRGRFGRNVQALGKGVEVVEWEGEGEGSEIGEFPVSGTDWVVASLFLDGLL